VNRSGAGAEAVRVTGLACAIVLWATYAFVVWTPTVVDRAGAVKGWDFAQFYALGRLAAAGDTPSLANGDAIKREAVASVSPLFASSRFAPVYGPQVALLFAPLARLSYLGALRAWIVASMLLYAVSCYAMWRHVPSAGMSAATATLLCAGSPALFFVACYGQISAIALALFVSAFLAFDHDRPVVAGLALGSLIYKPQFGLGLALLFVAGREWRALASAALAASAQIAAAWAFAGTAVMRAYATTLWHVGDDITLVQEKTHLLQSLSSFFGMLVPWRPAALILLVVVGALVVAAGSVVWASRAPLELRYSMLLVVTVLISPHFYVYDLVVLAPAGFLLAAWLSRRPQHPFRAAAGTAAGLLYFSPLAGGFLAHAVRIQPATICLLVLAGYLWWEAGDLGRAGRTENSRNTTIMPPTPFGAAGRSA
jgi:hypothetical protein